VTFVIAHRGAPAPGVADNSAAAVEGAIATGADMVEIDVRRSADGRLVLLHDRVVDGRQVRRSTLPALEEAAGHELMELAAAAELTAGRIGLDVELNEAGLEEDALTALRPLLNAPAATESPPLIVTSFLDGVLRRFGRVAPSVPTGLLLVRASRRLPLRRLALSGATYVLPAVRSLRSGALDGAGGAGRPAIPWTLNDEPALRAAFEHPAAVGLITDDPKLALSLRSGGV
jgi:glycerophosphoryl diester phosphodiesterase